MQRLADKSLSPPPHGDFRVTLPDGALVAAGTFSALAWAVWRRQQLNHEEPWTEAQIEDCLCRQLPARARNCDPDGRPFFSDILALPTPPDKDPEKFGPAGWQLLHTKRITDEPNPGQWLRAYHSWIPCARCSHHFGQIMQNNPPRFDDWLAWSVESHNAVNRSIGKEEWSLERANEFYGR